MQSTLRAIFLIASLTILHFASAQSLNGTLYLHYGKPGPPNYPTLEAIDFPSKQIQELRKGVVHDMLLDGDTLWLATADSLIAYDANTKQRLIALEALGIKHISMSVNGLVAGYDQAPFLRVHNRTTGALQFSFPQSAIDKAPIDVETHSIAAYVLDQDSVWPFDLDFMQPLPPIPTPELYTGLGYNTYLLKNADSLFVVTSYATGAPRHSVFVLDPYTKQVDTLYHKEFFDFFGIPFYADQKIIANHYLHFYDISTDSFYSFITFEPLFSVAFDEKSNNLFYIDLMTSNLNVGPLPMGFTASVSLGSYQHISGERALFHPVEPTGIEDPTAESLVKVSPNPASEQIQIEGTEPLEVSIYNIQGQQVTSRTIKSTSSISIEEWPSGLYLLHWETETSKGTTKLIKR